MSKWLYDRLIARGDQAKSRFAFQGTVNWMTALRRLCEDGQFERSNLRTRYQSIQRRAPNEDADTLVFDNLLMSFHNAAALVEMAKEDALSTPLVISATVAWYYSIYFSTSAMVAGTSGSQQEAHALTAKVWHNDIIRNNIAIKPFDLSLNTLVHSSVTEEIERLRNGNSYDLNTKPEDENSAFGATCSYLKGTAAYEKKKVEKIVKKSKEFKELNVDNFRTKDAQKLRDSKLANGNVNFLTQAIRFRGKANYRDSIYLSYGEDRSAQIKEFINDLSIVSISCAKMASAYSERKVTQTNWDSFISDIGRNLQFDIEFMD
ncbi:MAG: hypothetical protein OCC46_03800 [Pseudodesulfovibrio sp.]